MKNWIRTDNGVPINLDFLSKVMYAGDFTTGTNTKRVIYFHAIPGGGTNSGSTTAHDYDTAPIAVASYARVNKLILALMNGEDVSTDLYQPLSTISSLTLTTSAAGTDAQIGADGAGFSSNAPVVNLYQHGTAFATAIPCETIWNSSTSLTFTIPSTTGANTYDLVYTDSDGGTVILLSAYILT